MRHSSNKNVYVFEHEYTAEEYICYTMNFGFDDFSHISLRNQHSTNFLQTPRLIFVLLALHASPRNRIRNLAFDFDIASRTRQQSTPGPLARGLVQHLLSTSCNRIDGKPARTRNLTSPVDVFFTAQSRNGYGSHFVHGVLGTIKVVVLFA